MDGYLTPLDGAHGGYVYDRSINPKTSWVLRMGVARGCTALQIHETVPVFFDCVGTTGTHTVCSDRILVHRNRIMWSHRQYVEHHWSSCWGLTGRKKGKKNEACSKFIYVPINLMGSMQSNQSMQHDVHEKFRWRRVSESEAYVLEHGGMRTAKAHAFEPLHTHPSTAHEEK